MINLGTVSYVFWGGAFAKLGKVTVSFVMSDRMGKKLAFPLNGFSLSLVFEYFYKICREISLKSDKYNGYFT